MKICSVCSSCFEDVEEFCSTNGHGQLRDGPHSVDCVPGYRIESLETATRGASLYRARQTDYSLECFICISEGSSGKFLAEADAAARLFHAGVGGVVESGRLSSGSEFAASEAFSGTSLRDVLMGGVPPLLETIRIARQAAEAVSAIHGAGIVHGALRPENLSVSHLGMDTQSTKVHNIDFDSVFAKSILANRFAMESSREIVRYFAPEQFQGEQASTGSDVYALGILLYELLAGHPPFDADTAAAIVDMQIHQRPAEITISNFDLRMLLTHTISESLQKNPSFRQNTADLFARQMRHIEQLATHVSTPPPAVAANLPFQLRPVRAEENSFPSTGYSEGSAQVAGSEHPALEAAREETRFAAAQVNEPTAKGAPVPVPVTYGPVLRGLPEEEVFPPTPISVARPAEPVDVPSHYIRNVTRKSRLKVMKRRLQLDLGRESDVASPKCDSPTPQRQPVEPRPLAWSQPEDDVPSIAALETVLAEDRIESGTWDEEITAVRPPAERIQVEWDQPVHHSPFHRGSESERPEPLISWAMFGADAPYRSSMPKAAATVFAIGLLGLVGYGLFQISGSFSDSDVGYIGETSKPLPIEIGSQSAPLAEPISPVAPSAQVVNLSATELELPAVTPAKQTQNATTAESSKPVSKQTDPSPRQPAKGERELRTPVIPSTVVISANAGKPKVIVVSDAPPFGSRQLANEQKKRAASTTRPRIVLVPPED